MHNVALKKGRKNRLADKVRLIGLSESLSVCTLQALGAALNLPVPLGAADGGLLATEGRPAEGQARAQIVPVVGPSPRRGRALSPFLRCNILHNLGARPLWPNGVSPKNSVLPYAEGRREVFERRRAAAV